MARVEWTRLSGDEVEEIVAILLSRENRRATRVRPSQGDGGIDVIVPDGDGDSYSVYQIKKFTQNLENNEKKQISKSYNRLTTYVAEQGIVVSAWNLVMPLDPTNENRAWLSGVTEGASFGVDWLGLIFVDGLAAKYPDVIDYYARDGKGRLLEVVTELAQMMSPQVTPGPAGAIDRIEVLHNQMNRWDPHYKYDLMVTDYVPNPATFNNPGVLCVHQTASQERCVSIIIKARFDDAVNVRPIPMTLKFNVQPGTPSAEALREHLDYGANLELEDGQVEFSVDLPGGLGVEDAQGSVRIVSLATEGVVGEDVLLEILSPEGRVLASATLVVQSRVAGQTGRGGLLFGTETNGVFQATWRLDFSSTQTRLNIHTSGDFAGMRLEDLLNGVSFLSQFHAPNRFRIRNPYSGEIPDADEITAERVPVADALLQVVRSLLTIQEAARVQIRFPGMQAITPESANEWNRAAALLRGDRVPLSWDHMRLPVTPETRDELLAQLPAAVMFRNPLTVSIAKRTFQLGTQQFYCAGVTPQLNNDGTPLVDDEGIHVVPLDNYEAVITLLDDSRQIEP
ncbi:restriction endonuclease [Streptomyces sp. NPDC127123]|uniref:restriction endonuclease n=1 Tax=Streptomyces sp. NPDC127123 TaxID=3345372 RepID=UPI00363900ED